MGLWRWFRGHPMSGATWSARALRGALVLGMAAALVMAGGLTPLRSAALADPVAPADPSGPDASVPTMVVLDASGSMKAADGNATGATRMDVAKQSAKDLVSSLPDGAQLGLEVYGTSTGNTAADKEAGCRDVRVAVPVGSGNAAALTQGIDAVQASGYTPIGTSLRTAAASLPQEGRRAIVLVSDGIDSCAPPAACDVAKELKQQGVDLAVDVIGFKVDEKARADLSCIAEATGGTYADVSDGAQLSRTLVSTSTHAIQGLQATGTSVRGAERKAGAPSVAPGQYLDQIADPGTAAGSSGPEQYYALPKLAKGERVHATATIVQPTGNVTADAAGDGLYVYAEIVNDNGDNCAEHTTNNAFAVNFYDAGYPAVDYVSSRPGGETTACSGQLYLSVARGGTTQHGRALPLELTIASEPAEDTSRLAPAAEPSDSEGATPVAPASDQPTELSTSFSAATPLRPGSYLIDLLPGDFRVAKIPVAEGQRLSYRMESVDAPPVNADSPMAAIYVANPLREPIPLTSGEAATVIAGGTESEGGAMCAPVRLRNRESEDASVSQTWLGGEQYVEVTMRKESYQPMPTKPIRVLLTLQVDGTAQKVPLLDTGAKATSSASAAPSSSASDRGGQSPRQTTNGHRGWIIAGAVAAGLLGVAALGGGAFLLRRRSR